MSHPTNKYFLSNFNDTENRNAFMNQFREWCNKNNKPFPFILHDVSHRFTYSGTNSCAVRSMAWGGSYDKKDMNTILASFYVGSLRWTGKDHPKGVGKQVVIHLNECQVKGFEWLLNFLDMESLACFQNSWMGKDIHLYAITLDRPLAKKIKVYFEEECPLFLEHVGHFLQHGHGENTYKSWLRGEEYTPRDDNWFTTIDGIDGEIPVTQT